MAAVLRFFRALLLKSESLFIIATEVVLLNRVVQNATTKQNEKRGGRGDDETTRGANEQA